MEELFFCAGYSKLLPSLASLAPNHFFDEPKKLRYRIIFFNGSSILGMRCCGSW